MGEALFHQKAASQVDDFMGKVFEDICMEYMYEPKAMAEAPIFYGNVGRWWGGSPYTKQQEEIDIMAGNRGQINATWRIGKWTKQDKKRRKYDYNYSCKW